MQPNDYATITWEELKASDKNLTKLNIKQSDEFLS